MLNGEFDDQESAVIYAKKEIMRYVGNEGIKILEFKVNIS